MSTRIKVTVFTVTCLFCILTSVLFGISYSKGSFYTKMASGQQIADTKIRPLRGDIYDKNMISFTSTQKEKYVFTKDGLEAFNENHNQNGYVFEALSRYGKAEYARHLIGYLNDDYTGASGLEKIFNDELTCNKSLTIKHINTAAGSPAYTRNYKLVNNNYISDSNLKLTLDYKIQKTVEAVMDKYIEKGGVVILDAESFDVLAMASRPNFDRKEIENQLDSDSTAFINRCTSSYDAGSIFKVITAAAALKNPDYTHDHQFVCTGGITHNDLNFACNANHGILNFKSAFAKSCNCAFYSIGMHVGGGEICDLAKSFGIGTPVTNLKSIESHGNLPLRTIYSANESINISIGQGEILVTPLQAANIACIIANRGIAKDINIADSIVDKKGAVVKNLRSNNTHRVLDTKTADAVAEMMREAVLEGTAKEAQNGIFAIAGKTGTAQTGWYNDDTDSLNVHGWFIGFFPYDNPKYAMAVFCEDGKSGALSAIPPFKEIALQLMNDL